jgi:HAD superfamily hydrolase (TIGR01509 family)
MKEYSLLSRVKMRLFKCIIFDIDGTLTQTNDLIFASFNHVTQKYLGKTLSSEEIVSLFGPPEEGALARVFPASMVEPAMEELCSFYQEHHATMASLHPGMERALDILRDRNIHVAVFTGKGRRTTDITLKALGIAHYFGLVVSGNDVAHHKPAPDGIRRVLAEFGVEAGQTLMIGDAIGDLTAARAVGVPVASVLWDSYDRERVRAAKPDYLFETVQEFVDWLPLHV